VLVTRQYLWPWRRFVVCEPCALTHYKERCPAPLPRDPKSLAPTSDVIAIEDIAHHLALLNRFGGATRLAYSVAQHSVLVSYRCDAPDALHGLLHDGSEAYLGDLITPMKQLGLMRAYRVIEAQLQAVIYGRFGLSLETPASVKLIDERLAVTEAQDLFLPESVPAWARHGDRLPLDRELIQPWPAWCAEEQFLRRFKELTNGGHA
jgi:hypothetical protein